MGILQTNPSEGLKKSYDIMWSWLLPRFVELFLPSLDEMFSEWESCGRFFAEGYVEGEHMPYADTNLQ